MERCGWFVTGFDGKLSVTAPFFSRLKFRWTLGHMCFAHHATHRSFRTFVGKYGKKTVPNINEYAQYYADNIIPMKKSGLE